MILARNGDAIQRLRTDSTVRRGQWVALADVSPALRTALVLSEDKRFYEHSGVDWHAVSSAAWANLWKTKTRSVSTISMQLAGVMDDDLRAGSSGRSMGQKIGQTVSTRQVQPKPLSVKPSIHASPLSSPTSWQTRWRAPVLLAQTVC